MFKPMLADNVDLSFLKYPVVGSPKLDGVRATIVGGKLLSRNLKLFGNRALQAIQSDYPLDGELIVGDPTSPSCFRDTMKVVSAHDAPITDLRFHVFDMVYEGSFSSRLHAAIASIEGSQFMMQVHHVLLEDETALLTYEDTALEAGYEGIMLRDPRGKYKFGRSTAREGALLKLKRKQTSEAIVIGFEEQMHNANELKQDNLGYAERSSHQANMVPMGTLGALQVKDAVSGVDFNIGTGFTFQDRDEIWKNQIKYLGQICTYEFLPIGVKDKPRHPVFKGWRAKEDL
jgi:DNA ligase-1